MKGGKHSYALALGCALALVVCRPGVSAAGETAMIKEAGFAAHLGRAQEFVATQASISEEQVFANRAVLIPYTGESRALAQSSPQNASATMPSDHPASEKPSNKGYEPLLMLMLGAGMIGFSEVLRRTVVAR